MYSYNEQVIMVRESVEPTAGPDAVGKRKWDAVARNRTPCDKPLVVQLNEWLVTHGSC